MTLRRKGSVVAVTLITVAAGGSLIFRAASGSSSRAASASPSGAGTPTTTAVTATSTTKAVTTSTDPTSTLPATTTTSTALRPSATLPPTFSAVAGSYQAGTADGGGLYVRADGASRFSGPDQVACPSCFTASAPIANLDFSLTTLRPTAAGYIASGAITAESDPAWASQLGSRPPGAGPVGSSVTVTFSGMRAAVSFLPSYDVLQRSPPG